MSLPREFMLTDVRCFQGEQRACLRPITLLIGENSTGKTTFLGCYSVLNDLFSATPRFDPEPEFNREPFSMGSFRDIVRSRRGPQGRIDEFKIGLGVAAEKSNNMTSFLIKLTLTESGSQPVISNMRYEFGPNSYLDLSRDKRDMISVKTPNSTFRLDNPLRGWAYTLFQLSHLIASPDEDKTLIGKETIEVFEYIYKLFRVSATNPNKFNFRRFLLPRLPELVLVAPLRSKPQRTYNPVQEVASSEGDHVPMLMMRLDRTNERQWRPLHESLATFGRESGMFSDIRVRRLGKQMSDPFQLQVKARSGTPANIMDVGYGVSQSLPILVDIHGHKNSLFLLQQPEVHLHPRAQAELATVFAESVRQSDNSFLIETHSDYIVDRIRILVRQGKIAADDVSILYFAPAGNAVKIHNIELDDNGNLENVPPGYRDFFLRESDRLLGFDD